MSASNRTSDRRSTMSHICQRQKQAWRVAVSVSLRFVDPYGGSDTVGGLNCKEEPVDVWVIKCRACSHRRGYVINAREAPELKHVDEALTAAHVSAVAFVIHKTHRRRRRTSKRWWSHFRCVYLRLLDVAVCGRQSIAQTPSAARRSGNWHSLLRFSSLLPERSRIDLQLRSRAHQEHLRRACCQRAQAQSPLDGPLDRSRLTSRVILRR